MICHQRAEHACCSGSRIQAAAADRTQLIADTYGPAARQVDAVCGARFVNESLPSPESGAAVVAGALLASSVAAAVLGVLLLHVL